MTLRILAISICLLHLIGCSSTTQFVKTRDDVAKDSLVTVTFKRMFSIVGAGGPIYVLDRGNGANINGFALMNPPNDPPFSMMSSMTVYLLAVASEFNHGTSYLAHIGSCSSRTIEDIRRSYATYFNNSAKELEGEGYFIIEFYTHYFGKGTHNTFLTVGCDTSGQLAYVQRNAGMVEQMPRPFSSWIDASVIAAVQAGDSVTWSRNPGTMIIDVLMGNRYSGAKHVSSRPTEVKAGRSYRIEWEMFGETVKIVDTTDATRP
jgi:hypothetical protein